MRNDESERSQSKNESQEIPRVERNKNMKILDTLFKEVGVLLVSRAELLVDDIELNCWRKKKKERLRLWPLTTVS